MGDVFLAGIAGVLPPAVTGAEAIAAGAWTKRDAAETQQLSVTVAPADQYSPDLAVDAARLALERAELDPARVALALHSMMLTPGGKLWHGAPYIHRKLGIPAGQCIASDLDCGCASSLVALELATAYLATRDAGDLALVTAADCWREHEVDRWRTSNNPLGDGAAAAVVSRERGFARIAGAATSSNPELEPIGRGREPFSAEREKSTEPVYVRSRFEEIVDGEQIWRTVAGEVQSVVAKATEQAGIELADIDFVVCPFLGRELTLQQFLKPLSLDLAITPWEYSRRVGHIGPADPLAGLDHLVNTEGVHWRHILLLAHGMGGISSAVVLESCTPQHS
ncbi:3-oxoacyl-[acyl-carrier-protein] synthase-3 [Nocardia tenerifensis]|uniref:3-oxoacyl-[acyl-carrier-protein] synthase-3 n=1 Tax=Nocardia tenerifensis TaxID=228006 RepID=A0A318JUW5_9NOCA|nr:ketoacyl-ACP synthase III family protein [Nocardia tenerifensis]PXX58048.1 3-oxoacyl-[acyl-carrier-protein] synthase-3 [Nocardia tenerifensis]